jgi:molybdate transport system permease protein
VSPAESEALLLSFKVALAATLLALPVALAAALALTREFRGKILADALVHLPLALPPVAVGWLLLVLLGPKAPAGAFLAEHAGLRLAFHWQGAALASAVMSLPFQIRAIRLSLEAIPPSLPAAAAGLGAGRLDRLFSLTLPLALPGIVAGMVTGFAACLGEFGAVITFAANIPGETRTLPLALYTALQSPGGEAQAARLALISLGLAALSLALAEAAGRRLRRRLAA